MPHACAGGVLYSLSSAFIRFERLSLTHDQLPGRRRPRQPPLQLPHPILPALLQHPAPVARPGGVQVVGHHGRGVDEEQLHRAARQRHAERALAVPPRVARRQAGVQLVGGRVEALARPLHLLGAAGLARGGGGLAVVCRQGGGQAWASARRSAPTAPRRAARSWTSHARRSRSHLHPHRGFPAPRARAPAAPCGRRPAQRRRQRRGPPPTPAQTRKSCRPWTPRSGAAGRRPCGPWPPPPPTGCPRCGGPSRPEPGNAGSRRRRRTRPAGSRASPRPAPGRPRPAARC